MRSAPLLAPIGATLLLAGFACGRGEDPLARASGPPMTPPAAQRSAPATANGPPSVRVVRLEPDRPTPGQALRARVEAVDPDGDPLSLHFEWSVSGQRLAETGPEIHPSWSRKGDRVELRVTASDGRAESAPVTAATRIENRPPEVGSVRIEGPDPVHVGHELRAVAEASDPDGDPVALLFVWTVNGSTRSSGERFSTAGLRRGDRVGVQVRASDGQDESSTARAAGLELANAPPQVLPAPVEQGSDGSFRYRVRAEDPDGDRPLRLRLASGPEGLRFDERLGEVEWTPRAGQQGRHSVEILVEDRHGGSTTHHFELLVGGEPTAHTPADRDDSEDR